MEQIKIGPSRRVSIRKTSRKPGRGDGDSGTVCKEERNICPKEQKSARDIMRKLIKLAEGSDLLEDAYVEPDPFNETYSILFFNEKGEQAEMLFIQGAVILFEDDAIFRASKPFLTLLDELLKEDGRKVETPFKEYLHELKAPKKRLH